MEFSETATIILIVLGFCFGVMALYIIAEIAPDISKRIKSFKTPIISMEFRDPKDDKDDAN